MNPSQVGLVFLGFNQLNVIKYLPVPCRNKRKKEKKKKSQNKALANEKRLSIIIKKERNLSFPLH